MPVEDPVELTPSFSSEFPTNGVEWAAYIRENGASVLLAQAKGDWVVGGKPLKEDPHYGRGGIDERGWMYQNIKDEAKLGGSQISVSWVRARTSYRERSTTDFLLLGPVVATVDTESGQGRFVRASEVIANTDRPEEVLYVADFVFFGPSIEKEPRGDNLLRGRVLLPQSVALELLKQIQAAPDLYRDILNSIYPGIEKPEIKYGPTQQVRVIACEEARSVGYRDLPRLPQQILLYSFK